MNNTTDESKQAPAFECVCVQLPLYFKLRTQHKEFLRVIRSGQVQFDAHCVYCQKESTFRTTRTSGGGSGKAADPNWMLKPAFFSLEIHCTRNHGHSYIYEFNYDGEALTKYGQFPSLEDIAGADIRKYEKVMPDGYFGELKRATGLASHGIGIGSFVYLRRIFERMINDHHDQLKTENEAVDGFDTMRMDEKIAALKGVLPSALVDNRKAYGILSKGIHQLDEETCLKHFPVVRAAIIAILEQDLQQKEQQRQAANLRQAIADADGEIEEMQ